MKQEKQEINQLVIWTHPFFSYRSKIAAKAAGFNTKELMPVMDRLLESMKMRVDAIARKPNTAFAIVKTSFPNPDSIIKRTHDSFLEYCREIFGRRFIELPSHVGKASGDEKAIQAIKERIENFRFSRKLTVFRAGELKGHCPTTANGRFVWVIKEKFGIEVPPNRQLEMDKITYTEQEAWDVLRPLKKRKNQQRRTTERPWKRRQRI